MLSPSAYTPDRSLPAKLKRRLTQWRAAVPMKQDPDRAIVVFSFDDFPKSAADTGAEILDEVGAKGGFYACTGMAGTSNYTGEQFDERDLAALTAGGHEIGAHTQSHIDCSVTPEAEVITDIEANLTQLTSMGLSQSVTQFAWPFGETRYSLKPRLAPMFSAVRGVLPGHNRKGSDLMQLRAFELEPDDWTTDRAAAAIEAAALKPSLVCIFTHDVSNTPSRCGTTPAALRKLVRLARDSGALIATPSAALTHIQATVPS